MKNETNRLLLENVAAISADLHTDERFMPFKERYDIPFESVYDTAISMAELLTAREDEIPEGYWVDTFEAYAKRVLSESIELGYLSGDLEGVLTDVLRDINFDASEAERRHKDV